MSKKKEKHISFTVEGIAVLSLLIQNRNDTVIFKEKNRGQFTHLHVGENVSFCPVITNEKEQDRLKKHTNVGITGSINSSTIRIRETMKNNLVKIVPTDENPNFIVYVPTKCLMDTVHEIGEKSKTSHPLDNSVIADVNKPFFQDEKLFQEIPFKNLRRNEMPFGFAQYQNDDIYIYAISQIYAYYIPLNTIIDICSKEMDNLGLSAYLESIGLKTKSDIPDD